MRYPDPVWKIGLVVGMGAAGAISAGLSLWLGPISQNTLFSYVCEQPVLFAAASILFVVGIGLWGGRELWLAERRGTFGKDPFPALKTIPIIMLVQIAVHLLVFFLFTLFTTISKCRVF